MRLRTEFTTIVILAVSALAVRGRPIPGDEALNPYFDLNTDNQGLGRAPFPLESYSEMDIIRGSASIDRAAFGFDGYVDWSSETIEVAVSASVFDYGMSLSLKMQPPSMAIWQ
ncbi:hypothetical protein BC629DRAFT_439316 [Irpex lacteus]|nr:hypothetical protein BC629DRAFT_439316 [Irpex lacteus]